MAGREGDRPKPLDLSLVTTRSIRDRVSLVGIESFAAPHRRGATVAEFLARLPRILAGRDLLEVARAIVEARRAGRPVVAGMGAHVVKVGLNPIVIDLMRRGIVTAIAMNGAGAVHDFEIALSGSTSEDVAASLGGGAFGTTEETGRELNEAAREAARAGIGLGEALGMRFRALGLPNAGVSLLAAAHELGLAATVHVALGTDVVHLHPMADGAAIGEASQTDFRLFAAVVSGLEGGVYLNIGSAVILPEVFLKALTLARNLGHEVSRFVTVNLDFASHYRPLTNVVRRPVADGGKGYHIVGHHEILVPLLAAAVIEGVEEGGAGPGKAEHAPRTG